MNAEKKGRRGTYIVLGIVFVLMLGAGIAFKGRFGSRAIEPAAEAMTKPAAAAALSVSVVEPVEVTWPVVINGDGPIAPWQEATVNAEVSGARLVEVVADVGDIVTKGQLLARFDAAPAEAMLAQQKAALADAEAKLAEANENKRRAEGLFKTRNISDQDLIKARTVEMAASAQVDLAKARVTSQQLVVNNTRVVAPDDGVISSRNAMLGSVGQPGLELFRLIRQGRLEWRAELTASALSEIRVGSRAELQLPGGEMLQGSVRQVAPQLDNNSRTGIAYVALAADAPSIARAGMFASGTITVDERPALVLPSTAIVQRDGYEYVFEVDLEDAHVTQTKVTTGRRKADRIEVTGGVQAGDHIVESGGAFLNDGDRVHIVNQNRGPQTVGAAG